MKSAIEEYFPIVDVNRLAVPERNAFKPIYTMHKWFARRSSSVFRAILLGAMKPAGSDIMEEFYKDHTNDPDTKGKVILDPFMGGGTTVVEALRLGCRVVGVDLNPVAWFIVKTEVEPVDIHDLRAAFDRLAERTVEWSGKPLKDTLFDLYKTECPACGNPNADVIYTFWVKSAPCTSGTCSHTTPLFSDYIVAHKKPSIRFYPDCTCPECHNKFDWDIEPASMVGDQSLMVNGSKFSSGEGRSSIRWTFARGNKAVCPWCAASVIPIIPSKSYKGKGKKREPKPIRKKVELSVLYCPHCEEVWQHRGALSGTVTCPSCAHAYDPAEGNMPERGKFICRGACGGNVDAVIAAIRTLPEDRLLPMHPYALEGYCAQCAGVPATATLNDELFKSTERTEEELDDASEPDSDMLLGKNSGKFFKRISSADMSLYRKAEALWDEQKSHLPYPKSEVPVGEKTKSGLIAHHYRYWHQMFNSRQLLALSTVLGAIIKEENNVLKDFLLLTFSALLERNNMFCRYFNDRNTIQGNFDRHDFAAKLTPAENSVWGSHTIRGTYQNMFERMLSGVRYKTNIYDWDIAKLNNKSRVFRSNEIIHGHNADLHNGDSKIVLSQIPHKADCVITDPPYAGNVNYSELADFYYVWLRLALKDHYASFLPEITPKADEVIENRSRGKSNDDFRDALYDIFCKAYEVLNNDGLCVFTYHHKGDKQWVDLCSAVNEAGFIIESVYPVHGEKESSLNLQDNESISYDLIHVCRKRDASHSSTRKSWATIRQEIRRRARDEARTIESGRYGNEPLTHSDMNILLIGKCLELYSKHYGTIIDHEDQPVPLHRALAEIKLLVDQLVAKDHPIPSQLEDLDRASYIYFTTLCGYKEISADEMSKNSRGIIEPSELREHGLIIKGREGRGRGFKVKQPTERMSELKELFRNADDFQDSFFDDETAVRLPHGALFVDVMQLLIGTAEIGESVSPLLERFSGLRPQIRAALEYFIGHPKVPFKDAAVKVMHLLDESTLFSKT